MTVEYGVEARIFTALEALDRKVDSGLMNIALAMHGAEHGQIKKPLELEPARAHPEDDVLPGRVSRIEDLVARIQERVVEKDDLAAFGSRIQALTQRIDVLCEQIAGTSPRLGMVETGIAELRARSVPRTEAAGLERRVHELAARLDLFDQGHTNRVLGLSNQVTTWLVSLLLLLVGAVVSYALMGR